MTIALRLILALCTLAAGLARAQAPDDAGWNFDDFDDADPTLLELAADQAWDIGLFAAFATLAMVSFLRKSVPLKYVTLVAAVAYMGVYKSQLMSIVDVLRPVTGLIGEQNPFPVFSYSIAWYAFAAFTVVTTVLWGRVYCGRICAFGALTQLIDAIVPARLRVELPKKLEERASYIKYGILLGAIVYYLLTHEIGFYRYVEPFWMFTFEASTPLWVGLAILLVASVFVRNLYCRFLCPLGAALGILSNLTVFRIKRWSECKTCRICEKACEWGAIQGPKIVLTECVRCDDCERLYADTKKCPHHLILLRKQGPGIRPQAPGLG